MTSCKFAQDSVTHMRARPNSTIALLRRAAEFWPELFIVISVVGFAYIAINAAR
jgi:hypothetical protein